MNTKLLLLALSVAAISSCTTLYKSGQTPDDVYFSPGRPYVEAKQEDRVENRRYRNDDAAIRMSVYDPRWRYLDNDYRYSPYNYGFNHGYYYNPYFWPYPVYSPVFVTPTNPKTTTPRANNLGGYGAVPGYNNAPINPKTGRGVPVRTYNNNNGSALGNAVRKVLGSDTYNSNSSSNNNSNNNSRTYTPSTNTSSSSSSGSRPASSSGQVSRPPRGGN